MGMLTNLLSKVFGHSTPEPSSTDAPPTTTIESATAPSPTTPTASAVSSLSSTSVAPSVPDPESESPESTNPSACCSFGIWLKPVSHLQQLLKNPCGGTPNIQGFVTKMVNYAWSGIRFVKLRTETIRYQEGGHRYRNHTSDFFLIWTNIVRR